MKRARPWITGIVMVVLVGALGVAIAARLRGMKGPAGPGRAERGAAPVEVAPIEHGVILNRRVFSGALEATARIIIAPKVAGQVVSIPVDIADTVERGQTVATLEGSELQQAVRQAEADREVARAGLIEAESSLAIAQRELDRAQTLQERGVSSESQLDTVKANHLTKSAAVEVAKAQLARAEATLETARIRLGYTDIRADWNEGDSKRVVAERFVEVGDTVSANTPLLAIIELDPIVAVIYTSERDYALLEPGQAVTLTADAYPGRSWTGRVDRVAPMFREGSRQARVEIVADNPDGALKPGMFARVQAVLGRVDDATIVPVEALDRRDERDVVFVTSGDRKSAAMTPVRIGIRDGGRVQVIGDGLDGFVVTLGQQLLGEKSDIAATDSPAPSASGTAGAGAGGA